MPTCSTASALKPKSMSHTKPAVASRRITCSVEWCGSVTLNEKVMHRQMMKPAVKVT